LDKLPFAPLKGKVESVGKEAEALEREGVVLGLAELEAPPVCRVLSLQLRGFSGFHPLNGSGWATRVKDLSLCSYVATPFDAKNSLISHFHRLFKRIVQKLGSCIQISPDSQKEGGLSFDTP
jgi:hypothetical protein